MLEKYFHGFSLLNFYCFFVFKRISGVMKKNFILLRMFVAKIRFGYTVFPSSYIHHPNTPKLSGSA